MTFRLEVLGAHPRRDARCSLHSVRDPEIRCTAKASVVVLVNGNRCEVCWKHHDLLRVRSERS